MRIGQVIKARKLKAGMRVLVMDSEGQPVFNRVVTVTKSYGYDYFAVELEGISEEMELEGSARVVAWGA